MSLPAGYRFHHQGWYYKTENGEGPFFVTADGQAHQGLEPRYLTDDNGPYARLRVDVGQTGFFAGREFRTFREFSIPIDGSIAIKAIAPLDVILQEFGVELTLGEVRVELVTGGTETTPFTSPLPVFPTNGMSTASGYVAQVSMVNGGTHTGGTVYDLFDIVSGSNVNKAVVQRVSEQQPFGFAAGSYYVRIINTNGSVANGIFRARWEERP